MCIICLMLPACATGPGLKEGLDRSVKAYNRMLRWHEIESAVTAYGDPEQEAESLKRAESLKKRGLSVTDYRILSTKYLPEKNTGDVTAEFDYYILPSNIIKTVSQRQDWFYQEKAKSWRIKNALPVFE